MSTSTLPSVSTMRIASSPSYHSLYWLQSASVIRRSSFRTRKSIACLTKSWWPSSTATSSYCSLNFKMIWLSQCLPCWCVGFRLRPTRFRQTAACASTISMNSSSTRSAPRLWRTKKLLRACKSFAALMEVKSSKTFSRRPFASFCSRIAATLGSFRKFCFQPWL